MDLPPAYLFVGSTNAHTSLPFGPLKSRDCGFNEHALGRTPHDFLNGRAEIEIAPPVRSVGGHAMTLIQQFACFLLCDETTLVEPNYRLG
jgi:hypothetical protein